MVCLFQILKFDRKDSMSQVVNKLVVHKQTKNGGSAEMIEKL